MDQSKKDIGNNHARQKPRKAFICFSGGGAFVAYHPSPNVKKCRGENRYRCQQYRNNHLLYSLGFALGKVRRLGGSNEKILDKNLLFAESLLNL